MNANWFRSSSINTPMRAAPARFALLVALATLSACATLQPVQGPHAETARVHVEPGDNVRIKTTAGAVYELAVTEVGDDGITGVTHDRTYTVPYSDIATLEISEVSWLRTAVVAPIEIFLGALRVLQIAFVVVGAVVIVTVVAG